MLLGHIGTTHIGEVSGPVLGVCNLCPRTGPPSFRASKFVCVSISFISDRMMGLMFCRRSGLLSRSRPSSLRFSRLSSHQLRPSDQSTSTDQDSLRKKNSNRSVSSLPSFLRAGRAHDMACRTLCGRGQLCELERSYSYDDRQRQFAAEVHQVYIPGTPRRTRSRTARGCEGW